MIRGHRGGKVMNREKTIDALVERICDGECPWEVFTDALLNGRTGFNDMTDAELAGACETWGVEVQS